MRCKICKTEIKKCFSEKIMRKYDVDYFHCSSCDFEELKKYLKEVGFIDIEKKEFGQTSDKRLNLDIKERAWETLYVDAKK